VLTAGAATAILHPADPSYQIATSEG